MHSRGWVYDIVDGTALGTVITKMVRNRRKKVHIVAFHSTFWVPLRVAMSLRFAVENGIEKGWQYCHREIDDVPTASQQLLTTNRPGPGAYYSPK